jgi:hypothetical protein
MPIRPEERARYPKDWKAISKRIRERDGNRCAHPGCGAVNGSMVLREIANPERFLPEGTAPSGFEDDWYPVRIVLTVAHRDHTPENCDDANLIALCQLHHLRLDAKHHAKNARETRDRKRGQGKLFT